MRGSLGRSPVEFKLLILNVAFEGDSARLRPPEMPLSNHNKKKLLSKKNVIRSRYSKYLHLHDQPRRLAACPEPASEEKEL